MHKELLLDGSIDGTCVYSLELDSCDPCCLFYSHINDSKKLCIVWQNHFVSCPIGSYLKYLTRLRFSLSSETGENIAHFYSSRGSNKGVHSQ